MFAKRAHTMETLRDFTFLQSRLASGRPRKAVALACPHDSHTEYVIERALREGFARFTLATCRPLSTHLAAVAEANSAWVRVIACADAAEASRRAVAEVRQGRAGVLMKGTVNTDVLLHAVLDKRAGLLEPGRVMTHIAVAHIPAFPRLLVFSDAAVIPRPSLEQFDAIVRACAASCRRLGVAKPKIALTHCTEKVSPRFENTLYYMELKCRAERGDYGSAVVDGPMDVKTALDAESAAIKGIHSPVAGQADVLVFPNIEAGNTFYKTVTLLAGATVAGWLTGTVAPIVVASRADSEQSKFFSLALACVGGGDADQR